MFRKFTETAIKRAGNSAGISASEYYITTTCAASTSTQPKRQLLHNNEVDDDCDRVLLIKYENSEMNNDTKVNCTADEAMHEDKVEDKDDSIVKEIEDDEEGREIPLESVPCSGGWKEGAKRVGRYTYSQMTCKNMGKFVGGTVGTVLFGASVAAPQLLPLQFLYSAGMAAASVSSDRAGGYIGEHYVRPSLDYWDRKKARRQEERLSQVVEHPNVPEQGSIVVHDYNALQNINI